MVAYRRRERRSYRPGPPQHLSFGIPTTPSRRTFTHYQRSPRTIPAKKKYEKRPSARYVGYRSRRTYRVNEKVEDALKREASEELGITDFEARFLGNYVWESPRERELVFSFLCTRYNHIHIDNDEVDEGRFWTLQELAEGMEKNKLTPNLVHEYRLLLKPLFNRS